MPINANTFTLICFPYAGGSAAVFYKWKKLLSTNIILHPVEYPGHGSRFKEPFSTTCPDLVDDILENIKPVLSYNCIFYGHSFGSWISFEVIRKLRAKGLPLPKHLIVSGRHAPHIPTHLPSLSSLPDDQLINVLGSSSSMLQQTKPEILNLFLPILKSDIRLLDNYRYVEQDPLPCPITAIGGSTDPHASEEHLKYWRELSSSPLFSIKILESDHFGFIHNPLPLLHIISSILGI